MSGNIYQNSRKAAGYTQDDAAELLHISPRTLGAYETGASIVPDDIVELMIKLYHDPLLGYLHLQANPIARRFLPPIEIMPLSQAALCLLRDSANYQVLQTQLMVLCADNKIDPSEAPGWEQIKAAVAAVIASAFKLQFAKQD